MARKLHPCGTWAAYKRHLRTGEDPCGPCRQASRDQKNRRNEDRRRAREAAGVQAPDAPAVGIVRVLDRADTFDDLVLDPIQVALQDLRQIEAYYETPELLPTQFTNLSRRRQELIDRVRSLRSDNDADGGDPLDELAKRREDRIAATAD